MSKALEGRWFPWLLGLSLAAHGALPFLPGSDQVDRPDFKVEERIATEPMTVRIIERTPEPVPPTPTETPRPVLTSDDGARAVESFDVEPVEFEREPRSEPPPIQPPEPLLPEPPQEPPPENEPKPIEPPVELPPPPLEEEPPPPEPVKIPDPVLPPPKDVPLPELPEGPVEREGQSGVVSRAEPKGSGNRAPIYPRRARAAKMEGTTELEVTVGADGKVERAVVSKSSGHALLDDEALKAVKRWRFTPAKSPTGAATSDRVFVPITFRLTNR
ncbi:Gram-negative bacterial tonB protein [Planctomycetes bacterium Poly30]|uniref:Gram-negative bacterial tonB protein n=1 Tax=Saltatorellus ferox TaxID=2528018 RepID=A0A518F1D7_9BACT|nr:Gram-negative bacterial tonB protein [Planctomycetes bacterium Poly30]